MRSLISFSFVIIAVLVTFSQTVAAQETELRFATVERPPFSMEKSGAYSGFSIALMDEIAKGIGARVSYTKFESFGDMLGAVEEGRVDGAIANISITGAREAVMDFSQPIFRSGLKIMIHKQEGGASIWPALLSWDIFFAIIGAFALLFFGGMVMWVFERGKQPYFDRPASEAMFPSFWWALNLVVNGGFEERMPRSFFGRIFGVLLVVSSLFIVSVFVAKITTSMTVDAINNSVDSINDLDGKRVGTTRGSTASSFLSDRDIIHTGYLSYDDLIDAFEDDKLDAVVFDAPILAYYAQRDGRGKVDLLPRLYKADNYGIALPAGSELRERINITLLQMRENGTYDEIHGRWFSQ